MSVGNKTEKKERERREQWQQCSQTALRSTEKMYWLWEVLLLSQMTCASLSKPLAERNHFLISHSCRCPSEHTPSPPLTPCMHKRMTCMNSTQPSKSFTAPPFFPHSPLFSLARQSQVVPSAMRCHFSKLLQDRFSSSMLLFKKKK